MFPMALFPGSQNSARSVGACHMNAVHGHKGQLFFLPPDARKWNRAHAAQMEMNGSITFYLLMRIAAMLFMLLMMPSGIKSAYIHWAINSLNGQPDQ